MNDIKINIVRNKNNSNPKKVSVDKNYNINQLENIIQTIDNAPVSTIKSSIKILSKILKDIIEKS